MAFAKTNRKPRIDREARAIDIVEASKRCVMKHGFHATTMADIAAEVGKSASAIYRYFKNKEAIIEAIVAQEASETETRLNEIRYLKGDELIDFFIAAVPEIVEVHLGTERSALRLEVYAEAARNPRVAEIVRKYAVIRREQIRSILIRTMPEDTSLKQLDERVSVIIILFDGLLPHGLVMSEPCRPSLVSSFQRTLRHALCG